MNTRLTLSAGLMMLAHLNAAVIQTDADTYVSRENGGDPDTNYGTATTMLTRNDGGSASSKEKDQLTFFSFDLSSFTGTATSAKIELAYLSSETLDYAFELWGVNDGAGDEFFAEETLTFNNSSHTTTGSGSANDGSLDRTSGVTLLGSLSPSAYGTISFDSSDSSGSGLISFLNADTNNRGTFILLSTYETGGPAADFATKENGSNSPATLTVIPEASSLAVLMFGGLMLSLLARRRK